MDNWNAPQWADFNASLMSDIDEYFNVEHKELEPGQSNLTPYSSFTESPSSKASASRSSYNTPRSNGCASPRTIEASGGGGVRSTKTGDGLTPAASALRMKTMRQSMTPSAFRAKIAAVRASMTTAAVENDDNIEDNVEERRTAAAGDVDEAQCPETSPQKKRGDSTSEDENAENNATIIASTTDVDPSTPKTPNPIPPPEPKNPQVPAIIPQNSQTIDTENPTKKSTNETTKNPQTLESNPNVEQSSNSKLEIRPNPPPKNLLVAKKSVNSNSTRPKVLTSQARRNSSSKYRRRSAKYVSLAEAVSRFQHGTPERFRSANHKNNKSAPLQKIKQTTVKLTCPMSPALLCKFRTRAVSTTNQNSQMIEKKVNEKNSTISKSMIKIRAKSSSYPRSQPLEREKPSINAKPTRIIEKIPSTNEKSALNSKLPKKIEKIPSTFNKKSLINSKAPRKIEKIPTNVKSSIDSKPTRKIEKIPSSSLSNEKSMQPPKIPTLYKKIEKMLGNSLSAKDASMMSTTMMSESVRKQHTPCKKTVPTVVSTDEGIGFKEVEILGLGIPLGHDHKNPTRIVPFSFETRAKESKTKKEQTKNLQMEKIEVENAKKNFIRGKSTQIQASNATKKTISVLKSKENLGNGEKLIVRTLSFQERNEIALKKKKEMMEQIVEQEKRARIFHAKPAPNFKPVFVRGNSTENLRSMDGGKSRIRGISPSARPKENNEENSALGNRENKAPIGINQQLPKLKNPLIPQNLKVKKIAK